MTLNLLFGVRLRYYTGPCAYRADVGKSLRTISRGSMIVPELVLRLIKAGQSYVEVGLRPKPRTSGRTRTFGLSNVIFAVLSVWRLFVDIRVLGRLSRRAPSDERLAQRQAQ